MKVLIVDDHALVRRGMSYVVRECFPDADVAEAASANEAIAMMDNSAVDIALVDVRMPDSDGLELPGSFAPGAVGATADGHAEPDHQACPNGTERGGRRSGPCHQRPDREDDDDGQQRRVDDP